MSEYFKKRRSGMTLGIMFTGALMTLGCGEPNEPFNKVERFRLLGMKAEPPSLAEGEAAELSAFLHVPDGEDVAYKWSWCPFATNPSDGRECLVSEEDLADMVRAYVASSVGDEAEGAIPEILPSFDLGDGPTAEFIHLVPSELLREMCTRMISEEIPSFTGIPDCEDKLDVVIRLEATSGGESVFGVKSLPLYINGDRADNENPEIEGVAVYDENDREVAGDAEGVTLLGSSSTYRLVADVPADAPDTFTPLPTEESPSPAPMKESMFMTWYVNGGETEFVRTTFFDSEISFEKLLENSWFIPSFSALETDELSLYLVLQDERGGIGWFHRQFAVKER